MHPDRRDFLKRSASTAAALTLAPVVRDANVATQAIALRAASNPVHDFEQRMLRARPVPLDRVRVTGGPLKRAQDLTAAYLLALEPDRMLASYRVQAGLAKKAEPYTGWDGGGRNLTGHIAGHHLSGVSLMYRTTGDERFKARADYIVKELDEVQRKQGDGYCGALEGLREAFAAASRGEIRSGSFDLNGLWSPWYTLHKTYAGLRDAYRHTGNPLALEVETRFAAWAEGVLKPMSDAQVQKMLLTEYGGMNEVFADLYADTNDARWLTLSQRFEHHAFTTPLKRHQDNLSGKHGNCQIPKLMGSAARYGYTGDAQDFVAASFFWDRVVRHHSYASAGHGLAEYFGPPDELSKRVDGRAAETCNVYNMLKLTRRLFSLRPDASYADFHERALFNHILASIDPEDGRTSYMVPVGRREQQEYQDMQRDFTCCVGSGMESHAMHGLGVWYESADTIYANLFVPSTAECELAKARLTMETSFPEGETASIRVDVPTAAEFTLAVRRPVWAGDAFTIAVNGTALPQPALKSLHDPVAGGRAGGLGNESEEMSSSYVLITRTWRTGDVVSLTLPKSLWLEPTKDDPRVTAIMWGPLALAADHGPRREGRRSAPPPPNAIMVSESRAPKDLLATAGNSGEFRTTVPLRVPGQSDSREPMTLKPFYRVHRRSYGLYFDLMTSTEFEDHVAELNEAAEEAARLEAATVSRVAIGDAESEKNLAYRSEPADRGATRGADGRMQRAGTGWFEYRMPSDARSPLALVVTFFNDPGLPAPIGDFGIVVDGQRIATHEANQRVSGFHDAMYTLPATLTQGKSAITVRFEGATANSRIVPVYALRVVKR
ncbi:MAG: glycoside hydrolase family 127 protein [Gemmatimonadaceae bacterium]|nr:glycoside hydrolase family 127 protein [Gemmatimonadaceae bacterium]